MCAKSAFAAAAIFLFFIVSGLSAISAKEPERPVGEAAPVARVPVARNPLRQVNKYFRTQVVEYSDGTSLERNIISGPPTPPSGYEPERALATLPEPERTGAVKTLSVPAYNWVFGCSSVSGAMIAGYYDRNGYPNMYTGPTDGGIMPMDNSSWSTWSDGYRTYPNLPLAASHNGVDGRMTRGSIDDYWVRYDSMTEDPYITNGWPQHAWGTAIGDYMKTSQSDYENTDGSTTFYAYQNFPSQLTCDDMVYFSIHTKDGTYGRKLFYEARGYTVTDCYNQQTDNKISGGFSFSQYKAEIDAERPVMLNVEGHTMVGVGYSENGNTVYIHDTWDYSIHSMPWGGSYSGMALWSVSIVNLAPPPAVCTYTMSPDSVTVSRSSGSGSVSVMASDDGCSWTAVSNAAWITVTSGASGSGSGMVEYSYVANNSGAQRVGTITIAGKMFTITQSVCTYSISPASASVRGSSGSGTVTVTASGSSCSWTAVSNAAWITVTSAASGTGSGMVGYSYKANNTGTERVGTITIAGKTFTLTQKKKAGFPWLLFLLE